MVKMKNKTKTVIVSLLIALLLSSCANASDNNTTPLDVVANPTPEPATISTEPATKTPEEAALPDETPLGSKRVGEKNYGFITIPDTWVNFIDAGAAQAGRKQVAYASLDGLIIILDYFKSPGATPEQLAKNMAERIVNSGAENIEVNTTKIEEADAYQVSSYFAFDDTNLYVWFFSDKGGDIHYISVEGPVEKITFAIDIVEQTFSLSE